MWIVLNQLRDSSTECSMVVTWIPAFHKRDNLLAAGFSSSMIMTFNVLLFLVLLGYFFSFRLIY